MKLVKWSDQIEYLVKRKYPGSNAPPSLSTLSGRGSGGTDFEGYQKRINDIGAFKDELFKLSLDDVKTLYDVEYDKEIAATELKIKLEEQSRFFNLPKASADYEHWTKTAYWTLDEALALSFGKSPEIVTWDSLKAYINVSTFAKAYQKRRDLALRSKALNKLFDPIFPTLFISWANEFDIELPDELIESIKKKSGLAVNWFEEYKKIKQKYDDLVSNSDNSTSNNKVQLFKYESDLLKIQQLAISEFYLFRKNVDPKSNEVTEWIKNKGEELKINVSTNIAEALFTIIKPNDHNPKIKRG